MQKTTIVTGAMTALLFLGLGIIIGNYFGHEYTINTGTIPDWLIAFFAVANLYFLKIYVDDTAKIRTASEKQLTENEKTNLEQNYESHFFNLISGYSSLIGSVGKKLPVNGQVEYFSGKECLKIIAENIPNNLPLVIDDGESKEDFSKRIEQVFGPYYLSHSEILGHYFRYLFNILNYLDTEGANPQMRWQYVNILKANLSDFEFKLIFLNALTQRGVKFKRLIEKYSIFENWFRDGDPEQTFKSIKNLQIFSESAFRRQ